jgi:hypothetical protein
MFEPVSGILSVVSGVAGSVVTSIVNYKMKKLELEAKKEQYKYEIDRIGAETQAMIEEAKANIKVTEAVYSGKEAIIETEAFKESVKQADSYLFKSSYIDKLMSVDGYLSYVTKPAACLIIMFFAFVDILKAFIRPGVTFYELGVVTWLTYKCYTIMETMRESIFTTKFAQDLFMTIVIVLLQLFLVVTGWWFADRRISKDFTKRLIEKGWI